MSHWDCPHCGGRFRDDHVCEQDPANMAEELASLRVHVSALEVEVAELKRLIVEARLPRSR